MSLSIPVVSSLVKTLRPFKEDASLILPDSDKMVSVPVPVLSDPLFPTVSFLEGHQSPVTGVLRCSEDIFVSWSEDGSICVHSISTQSSVHTFKSHTKPVLYCTRYVDYTGRLCLVSSSLDRHIIIHDIEKLYVLLDLTCSAPFQALLVLPDLDTLICGGDGLQMFNIKTGALVTDFDMSVFGESIQHLLAIGDFQILVAFDKYLRVYRMKFDESSSSYILSQEKEVLTNHKRHVTCVARLANHCFVSASWDGQIIVWSANTLEPIKYFNDMENYEGLLHKFPYSVASLRCFDNRYILAAVGYGFALYDIILSVRIFHITNAHAAKVTDIIFLNYWNLIATCSEDASVRLWSVSIPFSDSTRIKDDFLNKFLTIPDPTKDFLKSDIVTKSKKDKHKKAVHADVVLLCELFGHANAVHRLYDLQEHGFLSIGRESFIYHWQESNTGLDRLFSTMTTLPCG